MTTRKPTPARHSVQANRRARQRSAQAKSSLGKHAGIGAGRPGGLGAAGDLGSVGGRSGRTKGGAVGNVGGYGSASDGRNVRSGGAGNKRASGAHRSAPSKRTPAGGSMLDAGVTNLPGPNGDILITRRHFLYGTLGAAALAAVGGGASVAIEHFGSSDEEEVTILEVPEEAVLSSTDLTEVSSEGRLALIGNFELPYGTLVWANSSRVAACLIPTEAANPLTQVALLWLGSGSYPVVLEQAVGASEGFEIYDVRASDQGFIWTEADILDGVWRIYTATLSSEGSLGQPVLADEGDSEWETPSIAVSGRWAFWQVMPNLSGSQTASQSVLKRVAMGSTDASEIYASTGRMSTPPYGLDGSVVITPRTNTSSVHYQLTRIDAESGAVLDTMVLPQAMKPLEAGWGETGFMFSFDAIYSYGDGIANLGTYAPASKVTDGNYSGAPWFRFARTPSAPPAWCGSYLMVKSTSAVCGINLDEQSYFALSVESGAADYGDYLATTGPGEVVVTYSNIDSKPLDGEAKKYCLVRVWTPAG